jgi:hypothetical protein
VIGPVTAAIEIKVHGSALDGFGVGWLQPWLALALDGFSFGWLQAWTAVEAGVAHASFPWHGGA